MHQIFCDEFSIHGIRRRYRTVGQLPWLPISALCYFLVPVRIAPGMAIYMYTCLYICFRKKSKIFCFGSKFSLMHIYTILVIVYVVVVLNVSISMWHDT